MQYDFEIKITMKQLNLIQKAGVLLIGLGCRMTGYFFKVNYGNSN